MKNEGITIARIYVYSNNKASLSAIRKLDFVHAGTVLRHHKDLETGEYVDDLIFHKLLDKESNIEFLTNSLKTGKTSLSNHGLRLNHPMFNGDG